VTEGDLGRVPWQAVGAILLRAFDEVRAATDSATLGAQAAGNDVTGRVRASQRPRFLERELKELLADGRPRTVAELAEKEKGGIGARRSDVEACLLANDHLFTSMNGREVGRSPRARVYRLAASEPTGAALPPETVDTTATSHNSRDGHGTTRPGLGLVEHQPSSTRMRTVELRLPTIKLLIGSDDR
jgi:hypothetical protein